METLTWNAIKRLESMADAARLEWQAAEKQKADASTIDRLRARALLASLGLTDTVLASNADR